MAVQNESRDALSEALHLSIKKSQWSEAVDILKKLIRLEPKNTMYLLRVGDYSAKIGAKKEAVAAYLNAGQTFSKNGFLLKAVAAYKMALGVEPNHREAHQRLQALHAETRGRTDPKMILDGAASPGAAPTPPAASPQSSTFESGPVTPLEIEPTSFDPVAPASSEPADLRDPGRLQPHSFETGPASDGPVSDPVSPVSSSRLGSDVIPLFANLTAEEFSQVIEKTTARSYPPGALIVREGEKGDSIYIVVKGRVKVVTRIAGQETALGVLNENDFFGEVAFLTGRPRTADVIALLETDLLELSGEALKALLVRFPHIREVLERLYLKRMQMTLDVVKGSQGTL
ncbi:MAG: cyclic nucleotide-binding domain-containing protein [Nitrospirae bacterium]|nr:cyclic nucleotide-binding domain-containing protein [Candidatus Manganitrophaceae bacterium]